MSFILDALRKSDQQRQRQQGSTPMIAPAPDTQAAAPALWWYGLLAAVLLGAGILIGSLQRGAPEPAPQAALPAATRPAMPLAATLPVAPLPVATTSVKRAEAPVSQLAAAPAARGVPPLLAAPAPIVPTAADTVITPHTAQREESARAAATAPAPEGGIVAFNELPPALQQELPKLAILVHSYASAPKARFVLIGDRKWHEEESPAPGLKLEQITPDGMIFSYKGYRFRRGINS